MRADAPFVARPVGDEASARRLAAELAASIGAPEPVLLKLGMNASYVCGDVVVRVGRPTTEPAAAYDLADTIGAVGIRVPYPAAGRPLAADGELAATAWQRIEPAGTIDWRDVGEMVARLHAIDPAAIPPSYPVPAGSAYPWWQFGELLGQARPLLDEAAGRGLVAAVDRNADWLDRAGPDSWVLCHGDPHPQNVMAGPHGPVLLDWDLLCVAPPAWDHAPLRSMVARWGTDPAAYRDFAAGYGAAFGCDVDDDPVAVKLTELRLVAATLMRVLAEGPDRSPDSEASRRLRYWRGEVDAPLWRVV